MERNKGSEREYAKKRRRAIINWLVYRFVAVGLIVACVISFISTQATLLEKRQEKADLESAIEQAKDENLELEKFVDAEDIEGYMEKAAIEDLNYAYPNERRFYDTSRN
jgi:cell division protein FtsL